MFVFIMFTNIELSVKVSKLEFFSIHITTLYLLANFVIIILTMVIVVMIIKCYLYKYEEIKEVCKPS